MSYKNNWNIISVVVAVLLAIPGFMLFTGCAVKERIVTQTVYQDVFVPVPCGVSEPAEIEPQENVVLAVAALKSKLAEYKAAFRACKGQ